MCIEVSRARFYVTKKPKICYKVLFKRNNRLYPPYYYDNMFYKLNVKYSIPEGEFENTIEKHITAYSSNILTTIGFYSFSKINDAKKLRKHLCKSPFHIYTKNDLIIVKCEIPENTKYLSGHEYPNGYLSKSSKSHCSQSIIIREIIK